MAMQPNFDVPSDFIPFCKFNSTAGRWSVKDSNGDIVELDLANVTFLIDIAHARTGWVRFNEAAAPDYVFDEDGKDNRLPPVGEGYKRGFKVLVSSKKNLNGLREFAANSVGSDGDADALRGLPEGTRGQ
jgi:hypothetical protein